MKSAIIAIGGAVALAGCTTLETSGPYIGRPIADAVRDLGPPHQVADYREKGRYFSWGTSDFIVMDRGADNPANWQTLGKRLDPIGGPKFEPSSCSLTLVAQWDEARHTWIARRMIRRDAGPRGQCGMRIVDQ